ETGAPTIGDRDQCPERFVAVDRYLSLLVSVAASPRLGRSSCGDLTRGSDPMQKSIRSGDKVARDVATENQGRVHLGDDARVFAPAIRAGDKVGRDVATANSGKVHLGDDARVFTRSIRAGDKVTSDVTTANSGKVHLGDDARVFTR